MLFQIAARPRDPTLFPPMTEEEVNRIMATPRKQAKKYVPPNMRGQGSIPGLGKPKPKPKKPAKPVVESGNVKDAIFNSVKGKGKTGAAGKAN